MRIAYLNTYCNGSTGRIIDSLRGICQEHGIDTMSIYSRGIEVSKRSNSFRHHNIIEFYLDALCTRLLDAHGMGNVFNTIKIIRRLKEFSPDIIHLHNLHGYWINYIILFRYIKKHHIKVVWTFHDCWHFTGHCTHFDYVKCYKWETCCHHCVQTKEFPSSCFDFSNRNYNFKKKCFTSIDDLVVVTPSSWLKTQVQKSFLNKYGIEVIHNGIDLDVFNPSSCNIKRDDILRQGFKAIVLGVAASWNERKGLSVIQEVARKRSDWFFVIIGTTKVEQRTPLTNMMYVDRTENVNELKDWYSAANVLAQPTLEDTYPTTNLEAIACGTPVVTFPTGGSEEIVRESGLGLVTKDCTSVSLEEALEVILCGNKGLVLNPSFELDSRKNYKRYIELYNKVYKGV